MTKTALTSEALGGVWTALVTPFKGRSIDRDVLFQLGARAADARIDGVVALGTTGESPTVTSRERRDMLRDFIPYASELGLPVMVGVGSNDVRHALEQAREAENLGADAILAVTPYYNKPTQPGLRRYFKAIADATDLPIVLYHIPSRCGVGISTSLVLELARDHRFIGIKDAGGDVIRVAEISRLAPAGFVVISGDDALTLPMISVGAVGVVSVLSNIAPRLSREMVAAARESRLNDALMIYRRLSPLVSALFLETSPAPIKEALNMVGLNVGNVRPPLARVTAGTRKALQGALADLGEVS